MKDKNTTVIKAMELLTLFKTYESLSLLQLSKLTGMPKTTVYRMVLSLAESRFLKKNHHGEYELGLGFLQYGQLVRERLDIRKVAIPVMRQLKDELGEAVNLIVQENEEAIYIEKIETDKPVRVFTGIGRSAPLYAGACPRVLLAFMPEEEREKYIDSVKLEPIASGTITDKVELKERLKETRAKGYTVSHAELHDDSSAIAAPIFDHGHHIFAGLSIVGPENRFRNPEILASLTGRVKKAADEISRLIGWEG
ncbi:IclR family transcriptional regulator [Pseudalkalibacillus salsuginis]|uniref:IclR family transcriptional regulator n=1 Tax=Pseudalkalibacillus salsuginis TaxID=2910972 RepID=UPI001F28CEC8|nr:IclR family transcriptional regulator [Pseudalkalibacillus salsuginis]MCF6411221.1 IclR family transcriptional regulator [Pseudalkalibacillus salsuginis]